MKTVAEIKIEVDRLATLIGAAESRSLATYGHSEDFARPHIVSESAPGKFSGLLEFST
jgi:hypothetical protein